MTVIKNMSGTKKLVTAGLCLALCILLPFLTAQIPEIGGMLLPMHIPALLCGFVCGPFYGLAVGLIGPLLRSLLFQMPPVVPTALCMAFELAAYGAAAAILYSKLPKKPLFTYAALVGAMLAGRVVWGLAAFIVYTVMGQPFTLPFYLAEAFIKALPGMILQLVLIPPVVIALRKTGFM